MDILPIAKAISSERRLKVLTSIRDRKYSAVEIYKKLNSESENRVHRETVYRDLEALVAAVILIKNYDTSEKKIYYSISEKKLFLNLVTGEAGVCKCPK